MKITNPIPTPTNKDKFWAQTKGFDADYIPGQDDGEVQEFKNQERDEDQKMEFTFEGSEAQAELLAKGIY